MTASEGIVTLLKEHLDPLGVVSVRRMFGGGGVYIDGQFIAIIADDVIYFKTDEISRAAFEEAGSEPFRYDTKKGSAVLVSYWRAPEALLDDGEEMCRWAAEALRAARAADVAKRKRPPAVAGARAPRRNSKKSRP